MTIEQMEKEIVFVLVSEIFERGWGVSFLGSGGIKFAKDSQEIDDLVESILNCGVEDLILYIFKEDNTKAGWVLLIFGNDGYDLVADHTTGEVEDLMGAVNSVSEILEDNCSCSIENYLIEMGYNYQNQSNRFSKPGWPDVKIYSNGAVRVYLDDKYGFFFYNGQDYVARELRRDAQRYMMRKDGMLYNETD